MARPRHHAADRHCREGGRKGYRAEKRSSARVFRTIRIRRSACVGATDDDAGPESRLFDTIRQELGGTYSITADPDIAKFPRPQYVVRIDWTCDPAQTDALVRRVFDEIASLKARPLSAEQMAFVHENLLREFERNSQDN